jgi:hypothetical protein
MLAQFGWLLITLIEHCYHPAVESRAFAKDLQGRIRRRMALLADFLLASQITWFEHIALRVLSQHYKTNHLAS